MIKRALCSLWGHLWGDCLGVDSDGHLYFERCVRCQTWKRGGR